MLFRVLKPSKMINLQKLLQTFSVNGKSHGFDLLIILFATSVLGRQSPSQALVLIKCIFIVEKLINKNNKSIIVNIFDKNIINISLVLIGTTWLILTKI